MQRLETAKDALLADDPDVFFTTPHFDGYAAILVRLERIARDERSSSIVASIISLAHALGLSVVAEGVETQEQLAHLRRFGCDRAQGWLFSGPVSGADFATHLAAPPITQAS